MTKPRKRRMFLNTAEKVSNLSSARRAMNAKRAGEDNWQRHVLYYSRTADKYRIAAYR